MHLFRRLRPLVPILALAVVACASSYDPPDDGGGTNPPPSNADVAGTWTIVVTAGTTTGVCVGESEPPWNALVTVDQSGSQLSAVSGWHSNPGSGPHTFTGSISGRQVQWSGSYPEGGGTLEARYDLTVATSGNSMSGTETWTWTADGGGGSCPNSTSTVTATRNN